MSIAGALAGNACAFDFLGDMLQCWIIIDQVIHVTNIFGAVTATKDKCKDYDKKLAHRDLPSASFVNREILSNGKFPVIPSIH